jgi:hypothetical protein
MKSTNSLNCTVLFFDKDKVTRYFLYEAQNNKILLIKR